MSENRSESRPAFEAVVRGISELVEIAQNLENCIYNVLDKQIVNRLLSQYDKLVKAGLTHQESLDAVTNLVRRRLETATQERSQNDN